MNQVGLFLCNMKAIVEKRGFIFVERAESLEFLTERGMTEKDLEAIILSLEPKDCFDGPEPDRDPRFSEKWTVAEFSPDSNEKTLYLKMSIRTDAGRCKCLSVKLYKDRSEVL